MISVFLITLWTTFLITRIGAHVLHDFETYSEYKPRESKAKTPTGFLRRKTGFDWHHIHLGFLILIIILPFILIKGLSTISIIFLAIGLSLIFDQLLPQMELGNYFSKKMILLSIIFHLAVSSIAILLQ